jgi:CubicO group peptidase (beta-lactamase class C family)
MDDYNIAGVSACIVRGREIIWDGAYGYANIEQNRKVNDSTSFLLASISKTVTGTALMQLEEQGLLNLDDDINDHLPSDIRIVNPNYSSDKITFRMIMTHTSSIDYDWSMLESLVSWGEDSPLTTEHLVRNYFLSGGQYYSYGPFNNWRPGSRYEYSNEAITLLGFLVDVLCDTSFAVYTRENVMSRLGMSKTGWFLAEMDTQNLAVPYEYQSGFQPLQHYGNPAYPCGWLKASAKDLGKLLLAYMNKGELNSQKILDSSTIEEMTTVQFPQVSSQMGLIWFLRRRNFGNGQKLYCGHNGSLFGCSTEFGFQMEEDVNLGAVVLTNGESYNGMLEIFGQLFIYGEDIPVKAKNDKKDIPLKCVLHKNYPNPFKSKTFIEYHLPANNDVNLSIYTVTGQKVATLVSERQMPGNYEYIWDAGNLAAGLYYYRLTVGDFVQTSELMLLK